MNQATRHTGFSLIELMVALAIVGILAAIAYPGYLSQVQKSRRADAKIGLTQLAQQLERCFTEFNVYNSVNCAIVGATQTVNIISSDGYYTLQSMDAAGTEHLLATPTAANPGFVLYAIPVNTKPQASDACGTFSLDSFGNKAPTTPGCWE